MFIPEFVCGILATIGVEILLLIGYAIAISVSQQEKEKIIRVVEKKKEA